MKTMRAETPRRHLRRLGVLLSASALGASMLSAALPMTAADAATTYKTAKDGAKITSVKKVGTREYDVTVSSPKDLGMSVKVRMLLPKGWSRTAKRTWPVVYAYHGGRDTYVSWTRSTDIEKWAAKYDVMVVMPEGASGSYTDWFNYGKGGIPKWEDFHLKEVIQLMERNFRAGPVRAAMGLSSGGQGAMTYAGRNKGLFRYVASFSGVLSFTEPGISAMLMYTNSDQGRDPFAIWGVPVVDQSNWDAHDPYQLAPNLKGTKIYFSSGTTGKPGKYDSATDDTSSVGYISEVQVGRTAIAFRDRLKSLGIPFTSDIYGDGKHSWPYWQDEMHKAWPDMMKTLGAKKL